MSLRTMNRGVKKYGVPVILVIAGLMAFTSVYRSGGGLPNMPGQSVDKSDLKTVATAGSRPIYREELDKAIAPQVQQYEMMGSIVPAADKDGLRLQALESFHQEAALLQIGRDRGIKPTPIELSKERDTQWEKARGQLAEGLGLTVTATDTQIEEALSKNGMSIAALKERALTEDFLSREIIRRRLEDDIKKDIKVDAASVRRGYDDVRLRKIVIPFGDGKTTEEVARTRAQSLLDQVKAAPDKMPELSTNNSADSTKKTAGLSNVAMANTYAPELIQAAFATGVGKIHPELVRVAGQGESAFHIVKLEEDKPNPKNLPKDFDKNLAQYVKSETDRRVGSGLFALVQAELPKVPVNITDPLLKSASLMSDAMKQGANRSQLLQDALNMVAKVDPKTDNESVAPLRKAQILELLNRPLDAMGAYRDALKTRNLIETRLKLIDLLIKSKQVDEARKELVEVEKMAVPTSQMAYTVSNFYIQIRDNAKAREWANKGGQLAAREKERMSERFGASVPGAGAPISNNAPNTK